ncbi:hypothetical protein SNE40_007196 [Patella caerulea]|uniref:Uncharacterized protein n=1 Tax=Patella caerulea TaxID=87958 RepID=A0AAN8JX74_PATCE
MLSKTADNTVIPKTPESTVLRKTPDKTVLRNTPDKAVSQNTPDKTVLPETGENAGKSLEKNLAGSKTKMPKSAKSSVRGKSALEIRDLKLKSSKLGKFKGSVRMLSLYRMYFILN